MIPMLPRPYEVCDPEEKLRRLRFSYAEGRMTLEELERRTAEAVVEQDFDARHRDGLLTDAERKRYDAHMDKILDALGKKQYNRVSKLRREWSDWLVATYYPKEI